ncbi:MAG: dihydrolipoamide acetyltransferase family protein [Arenicellales bacterium]
MKVFKLPDLGEGLKDAEIVSWHVSTGDHVVVDQPLVSVETDKAVIEIPSPWAGNIVELFAETGDVIETGSDLVAFDSEARSDPGAIVGSLPKSRPEETESSRPQQDLSNHFETDRINASPAVRQLARERGIDLKTTQGSGPNGAITTQDVKSQTASFATDFEVERITGVRRAMVRSMSKSGAEVVPATVTDQADIERWPENADITIRLVRAIEVGVAAEPGLNAWFYPDKGERWVHRNIDLGLAVDTPDGLFAPVLRSIASRSDQELRKGLEKLRHDVAARSIPPNELRGQTISLSNFGMIGGRYAVLVVVPPQVAILGAGKIMTQAVMENGEIKIHRFLPLSLTFDHRVVTGGEAARFLSAVMMSLQIEKS